jgi:hypothetical protein
MPRLLELAPDDVRDCSRRFGRIHP